MTEPDANKGVIVPTDDKTFTTMLVGGLGFIPRITLGQGQSEAVQKGQCKPGEFMFFDKNMGKEFHCKVGPWRPHALLTVDQAVVAESFDPTSAWFNKIVQEFNSGTKVDGRWPMFGVDFCLWIPNHGFGVYFLAKTARRAAPDFKKLAGQSATIYGHFVEGKSYSWWVPLIKPYEGQELGMPDPEEMETTEKLFLQPKEVAPELAEKSQGDRPR